MGRPKIRNYPSRETYEQEIKEWFQGHKADCEALLLRKFGYESIEQLQDAEYNMKFGFDCGWVNLYPLDAKMEKEWKLDNGDYGAYLHDVAFWGYNTQSVTLKEPLVDYMLKETGLDKIFVSYSKLDQGEN